MLSLFRQYIRDADSPIASFCQDTEAVAKHFGIDTTNGFTLRQITDRIYEQITLAVEVNTTDEGLPKPKLYELIPDLIDRHVLFGEEVKTALEVLEVIKDSCRTTNTAFVPLTEADRWRTAISLAKSHLLLSDIHRVDATQLRSAYTHEYDKAVSLQIMRNAGAVITKTDDDIDVEAAPVFEKINADVQRTGGITMARYLFKLLHEHGFYDETFDRFLITREIKTLPEHAAPQLPFGYLFNLCMKYPYHNSEVAEEELNDTIQLAVAACQGVYDVQDYNIWTYLLMRPDTIVETLRNIATWDSIYSLVQVRYTDAIDVAEFICRDVAGAPEHPALPASIEDIFKVVRKAFSLEQIPGEVVCFDASAINDCGVDTQTTEKILDFFSHADAANTEYLLPNDIGLADSFLKPLIKKDGKYLLFFRGWNSGGVYECIATALRASFKKKQVFDSKTGLALEAFIRQRMTEKGISVKTGTYAIAGVNGEADIVTETAAVITLIEMKKKVLTRKAKSGMDVHIVIDLLDSILAASLQSSKSELLLRQHGQLSLSFNGNTYLLQWRDRKFEHVAITQMEYGGFHDRSIIQRFLTSLLTHSFMPYDTSVPAVNEKFELLNAYREELVQDYNAFCGIYPEFPEQPFFNHWFLSYHHLLEIIHMSTGNEDFYTQLVTAKHAVGGTFDFYAEYLRAKQNAEHPLQKFVRENNKTWVRFN